MKKPLLSRSIASLLPLGLGFVLAAAPSAHASGVTHQTATTSGIFSAATWTNGAPSSPTIGDIAETSNTAAIRWHPQFGG